MSEFIILPCGCRITETSVLGMCGLHVMELHRKKTEREGQYAAYRRLFEMDRPQSAQRRDERTGATP